MSPARLIATPRASREYRALVAWIALAVVLLGFSAAAGALLPVVPLFGNVIERCPDDDLSAQAKGCITVEVSIKALELSNVDLRLELPGEKPIEVSRVNVGRSVKRPFIWRGTIRGKAFSRVTFSVVNNSVVGIIAFDGKMYRLRSTAGGDHIVEELDPKQILPGGDPPRVQSRSLMMLGKEPTCYQGKSAGCVQPRDLCQTDDPFQIDVMVLYTRAARLGVGGADSMSGWIDINEDDTNESYIQSNATQRIRVVHRKEVAYESVSATKDLETLTLQCDTKEGEDADLNVAHSLRNEYGADVVVLVTHSADALTSGLSNQLMSYHRGNNLFEPCAFSVVRIEGFTTPANTFAHELGHVMGAQHEYPGDPGAVPESSFGHVDTTPSDSCVVSWKTIMAQGCVECDRPLLWSNRDPSVTHCGEPVGTDLEGDRETNNRDTLNVTAHTIAKFRCRSEATAGDVWMKDTWEDRGAEPDPELATAPMSESPYIWVRNKPDPDLKFAETHQLQNPIAGQTNYIYVKIHNGGGTSSGTLEVWAAKDSADLSWPSTFVPAEPVPIPLFTGKSTRIAELQWTPPDSGLYALVARWDSPTDPMTTAETNNISENARANNNIVWRNVRVVDLEPIAQSADPAFIGRK